VPQEGYNLQQSKLISLKRDLDADPTNIEGAKRYWFALASFGGHDVRSGKFAIEAFRGCAVASHTGMVALANALRALYEKTGEKPRSDLFDQELLQALKASLPHLTGEDLEVVQWISTSL
jgi:hypothetical protein